MKLQSHKFIILIATFIIGVTFVVFWLFIPSNIGNDSPITSDSLSENDFIFKEQIINEQNAVYTALIEDLYIDERTKLLVFDEETTGCLPPIENEKMVDLKRQTEDYAINKLTVLLPQTISNFQNQSRQCNLLNPQFSIPTKFIIASKSKISKVFLEDDIFGDWSRFYTEYPNSSGLINFSNIGFNSEMTQAFVYTGRSCGGKCGAGYYVVLQKKQNKQNNWIVTDKVNSWVS
jgi:hypothetical protein